MRHGDEGVQALEWAYGRLGASQAVADAIGIPLDQVDDRVWPDVAPQGTDSPWIVVGIVDLNDRAAVGPQDRIYSAVGLDVRVTAKARSYGPLAAISRAIYDTLHARTNDALALGGVMLSAKRVGGIQYPETAAGIEYRHLGHTFQVEIN
jgi:hypothetical protein